MSKILAIKSVVTKVTAAGGGKPNVLVTASDRVAPHWVPFGMWTAAGNDTNFEAYLGGEFDADYFQKGEELISGDIANDDNIILRSFSASMNPVVLAHMSIINSTAKADALNGAALLFRARREEAQAKAKAAKAAADAIAVEAAAKAALAAGVKGPEVTA